MEHHGLHNARPRPFEAGSPYQWSRKEVLMYLLILVVFLLIRKRRIRLEFTIEL